MAAIRSSALALAAAAAAFCVVTASAQMGGFDPKEAEARFTRWKADAPRGSGPWPAARSAPAGLPTHTIYAPAALKVPMPKLPIVAFGNGGCRNTSIEFAAFLGELASRGYLIVAVGTDDVPFGMSMTGAGTTPSGKRLSRMEPSALVEGVDWAIRENSRVGSPFRGRLATDRIAYMGQSCGGLQALNASEDKRTRTTVVLNSGYFAKAPPNMPMPKPKPWTSFHAPIAFFTGGPGDVAQANAEANFRDAPGVPMFKASLPVGHTGAYPAPDMRWAGAVTAWLDWQLKGDRKASRQFLGPNCGLCTDKAWSGVASHNLR